MLKKSLSEQIYEQLRMDIIFRKISLGEKLTNNQLQQRFKVSSSPVRDAINKLYFDGLLSEVTRAGAKVIELDDKTFKEANEVLSMLNCTALKLSYNKGKDSLLEQLEEYVQLQKENIDNDEYYKYDYMFHKTLFDFADNSHCKSLFKRYHTLHELLVRYRHIDSSTKVQALGNHEGICEAIRNHDLHLATEIMEQHYNIIKQL